MNIYTIGFTKKSAEQVFEKLRDAKVRRVIDIRLNNVSQLSGFAKRDDLAYFLRTICNIDYVHMPLMAPTQTMLDNYKKSGGMWETYATAYNALMGERNISRTLNSDLVDGSCFLCSEAEPEFCPRRLLADILQREYPTLRIQHLI